MPPIVLQVDGAIGFVDDLLDAEFLETGPEGDGGFLSGQKTARQREALHAIRIEQGGFRCLRSGGFLGQLQVDALKLPGEPAGVPLGRACAALGIGCPRCGLRQLGFRIREIVFQTRAHRKLPAEGVDLALAGLQVFLEQLRSACLAFGSVGSLTFGLYGLLQALEVALMRIARGAVELGLLGVERFLQLADFLFVFRGALVIPALRRPRLFAGLRMAALQLANLLLELMALAIRFLSGPPAGPL